MMVPKLSAVSRIFVTWLVALAAINNVVLSQYIQTWQWRTENGEEIPYWRHSPGVQPRRVVQFATKMVFLEYNCHHMPAICQNAWQFINSPVGRSRRWRTSFTYDMKSDRGTNRRNMQCPKGQGGWRDFHSCPEVGGIPAGNLPQPPVMPGPHPFVDLQPPGQDRIQIYEIRGQRIGDRHTPSGRYYSCDEFPAAKWVEGGVGTAGKNVSPEGDGQAGTTRCAPDRYNCKRGKGKGIDSEQTWQKYIHLELRNTLWDLAYEELGNRKPYDSEAVMFEFRLTYDPNMGPARVLVDDRDNDYHPVRRGMDSKNKRLSAKEYLDWASTVRLDGPDAHRMKVKELVIDSNGETKIRIDGILHDPNSLSNGYGPSPAMNLTSARNSTLLLSLPEDAYGSSPATNRTADTTSLLSLSMTLSALPKRPSSAGRIPKPWNITAGDVDVSLTKHKLHTPRQPKRGRIDILAVGTNYILGQIGTNTTRAGNSGRNNSTSPTPPGKGGRGKPKERKRGAFTLYTPLNKRDGPVQCGPNQPCLDESCCDTDGKCGYTAAHCGAGNCTSNCDAKAMCGIHSADSLTPCGLKLCCSYYGWCGTEKVHCEDPEPQYGKTPCQQGYGSCTIKPSPSCGTGSGTSRGRRVGYYQGWNTRDRVCDKVYPSQINTRGLTHLFYSFALFHPTTFQIMPMNEGDIPLYGEFTALKRNGLQTWIAIGGVSCHSHLSPVDIEPVTSYGCISNNNFRTKANPL